MERLSQFLEKQIRLGKKLPKVSAKRVKFGYQAAHNTSELSASHNPGLS
jgi:hypothetical protein